MTLQIEIRSRLDSFSDIPPDRKPDQDFENSDSSFKRSRRLARPVAAIEKTGKSGLEMEYLQISVARLDRTNRRCKPTICLFRTIGTIDRQI